MIDRKSEHRLRAGVLPLTLAICLILSIICTASILFAYYNNLLWIAAKTQRRVSMNVDSAVEYFLAGNLNGLPPGASSEIDLFGEGRDSVRFKASVWGLFDRLLIEAYDGGFTSSKDIIVGYRSREQSRLALYVSNSSPNALTLVGDARIYGNASVPQGGIKAGYYNRQGYSGKQLIDGEVQRSEKSLPVFDDDVAGKIQDLRQLLTSGARDFEQSIPDRMVNSFANSRITYFSEDAILVDSYLDGNIAIVSQSDITISSSAALDNVILVAPIIRFTSGFKGCLQAFATNEIVLEKGVVLKYPSALVVDSDQRGKITITDNCSCNGLVMLSGERDTEGMMKIAKSAVINGQVVAAGKCDLEGTINGQLICKSLNIMDGSGDHVNFLKDGVIDGFGLPKQYLYPGIFNGEKRSPGILINL